MQAEDRTQRAWRRFVKLLAAWGVVCIVALAGSSFTHQDTAPLWRLPLGVVAITAGLHYILARHEMAEAFEEQQQRQWSKYFMSVKYSPEFILLNGIAFVSLGVGLVAHALYYVMTQKLFF